MNNTSIFNPTNQRSLNHTLRARRFAFFKMLLEGLQLQRPVEILDIGGTQSYWERMMFTESNDYNITLLNLEEKPVKYKNFKSVRGNACDLSEYRDQEFDIVFSNSVIEHLFTKDNQFKMAAEVRRVGRNYYIQTPNYYFPVEPHWLFPGYQFLPFDLRVFLTKNFNLGHYRKAPNREKAVERVREVNLLTEGEMKQLFPEAKVKREYFMGLVKSISMYHFPGVNA